MSAPRRKPLSDVVRNLLTPLPGEEVDSVGIHLKALSEAVDADACVIMDTRPGKNAWRILGASGLRIQEDQWAEQMAMQDASLEAVNLTEVEAIMLKGPFEDDPFLKGEGAATALFMPVIIGDLCIASMILKRTGDRFKRGEIDRFTAVAGVVNMALHLRHSLKGSGREHGTDQLTGLGLFSDFHESMVKELSRARRGGGSVTMGIMEIVPEVPGLADKAILKIARLLKEKLRNFDTLDRYSSSDLAFILPELRSEEGVRVVERVTRELITSLDGEEATPDIYIGLSCYPEDGASVERLIETAEAALNKAVEEGRPGVYRWRE